MDSTVVIVLVFVFAIFSSFGGNQGYHQPVSPNKVVTPTTNITNQTGGPIAKGAINYTYLASDAAAARSAIQKFILGFRKPAEAVAITDAIMKHSQTYGVNPRLVAALMRRESGYNPRAISKSGAVGLGQLLPSTCTTTGVSNPYNIDDNTKGTVRYMKYLLDKFKSYSDPVSFALAGYLEGPNAVARKKGYKSTTAKYVKDIIAIYYKI